jgi:GNAT superfamily N-acetyltransferase
VKKSLLAFDAEFAARTFNRCFEDYLVRLAFSPEDFDRRIRAENVDLSRSTVYFEGEDAVAICLIAVRGRCSRVAAMGIVPERRGHKLGRTVIEDAIAGARAAGERRLILEVIEQNERALRLYERTGFSVVRRLLGFERGAPSGEHAEEIDAYDAAKRVATDLELDVPWQTEAQTLLNLSPQLRVFELGDALAFAAKNNLRMVWVPKSARGRGAATRLLRALANVPELGATPIFPEGVTKMFERAGWKKMAISQLEMAIFL